MDVFFFLNNVSLFLRGLQLPEHLAELPQAEQHSLFSFLKMGGSRFRRQVPDGSGEFRRVLV